MMKRFYKVIVISVEALESRIIDERHFPDYYKALSYSEAMKEQNYVAVMVQI